MIFEYGVSAAVPSGSLSTGAIVGIVVGCVVLVAIVIAAIVIKLKWKSQKVGPLEETELRPQSGKSEKEEADKYSNSVVSIS